LKWQRQQQQELQVTASLGRLLTRVLRLYLFMFLTSWSIKDCEGSYSAAATAGAAKGTPELNS
jgi:hypothetical protein